MKHLQLILNCPFLVDYKTAKLFAFLTLETNEFVFNTKAVVTTVLVMHSCIYL